MEDQHSTLETLELNGFRHPISAQVMLMTGEERVAYLEFTRSFTAQFEAANPLEEQLAFALADGQWRLNHVRALQNNMLSVALAASDSQAHAAVIGAHVQPKKALTLATLSTHEQRVHRQFHQDLRTLRELQAARRKQEQEQLEQAAQLLKLERARTAPGESRPYRPADDGIAIPLEKIEAHLRLANRREEARRLDSVRNPQLKPPGSESRKRAAG